MVKQLNLLTQKHHRIFFIISLVGSKLTGLKITFRFRKSKVYYMDVL